MILFLSIVLFQLVFIVNSFSYSSSQRDASNGRIRVRMSSIKGDSYRLWDEKGVTELGLLAKPVGLVLNIVADLLRIQGDASIYPPQELKKLLVEACNQCQPNGMSATPPKRAEIESLAKALEASNPTRSPSKSSLMNGYWQLLYTTSDPGPNSGKLGPFVGKVYQLLDSNKARIENICEVDVPSIRGVLKADQSVIDSTTWKIDFDDISTTVFGIKLFSKKFPSGTYRLWDVS